VRLETASDTQTASFRNGGALFSAQSGTVLTKHGNARILEVIVEGIHLAVHCDDYDSCWVAAVVVIVVIAMELQVVVIVVADIFFCCVRDNWCTAGWY
jgi:hypothetical protein